MKKTSLIAIIVTLFGMLPMVSYSQTINPLNGGENGLDDLSEYLGDNGYHVIYEDRTIGYSDEEAGTWTAYIDRSSLPQFTLGKHYGVIVAMKFQEKYYFRVWAEEFPFTYNINDDAESTVPNDYGTLEYDGVGIYCIIQNPISTPSEDDGMGMEEPQPEINDAYFQSGDYIFDNRFDNEDDPEIIIFIYDNDENY